MNGMAEEDGSETRANERTALLQKPSEAEYARDNVASSSAAVEAQQETQASAEEEEWSTARLCVTLGSAYIGVFLAAMDSTIVATLSTPISNSFSSFTLLSWLASAYLIANAGFQPISGKLSDIFGRRSCLIAANIFFAAGNLICGLAKEESVIILGRVVSGIGGGCINTITTFVASDLVPLRRRGIWQGVGNICFGVGSGLGGVFGGWISDRFHWRWAFIVQVPLILLSTLVVFFTMKIPIKDSNTSRIKRVDFLGAITLVIALVLLLLGLNSGGNIVPWNHPLVYVSIPISGLLLLVFIYIEDKVAAEPIIPVRLLLDRTVASGCFTNWVNTMAYFSYLYYGQIYFQVRGLSSTGAGLRLVPNALGLAVGSLGAGLVMRLTGRYWYLNLFTQAIFVLACALMFGLFDLYTPVWPPFVIFVLGGLGYGSMLTITLLALISAVPHEFQAVITSASYAARSTGSTLGITIASAVFQNVLATRLWQELGDGKNAAELIKKLRDNINFLRELEPSIENHALTAYMDALRSVFGVMLLMSIIGGLASLFMRENTLHSNLARK